MTLDVRRVLDEISSAPPYTEVPLALAIARINDVFRDADAPPVSDVVWKSLREGPLGDAAAMSLTGAMSHLFVYTSLRAQVRDALAEDADPAGSFAAWLGISAQLTGELVLSNPFRAEEALRKWARAFAIAVSDETPEASERRLEQLDFGKAMQAFEKARREREEQASLRAEAIRAAQAAEPDPWRE